MCSNIASFSVLTTSVSAKAAKVAESSIPIVLMSVYIHTYIHTYIYIYIYYAYTYIQLHILSIKKYNHHVRIHKNECTWDHIQEKL